MQKFFRKNYQLNMKKEYKPLITDNRMSSEEFKRSIICIAVGIRNLIHVTVQCAVIIRLVMHRNLKRLKFLAKL